MNHTLQIPEIRRLQVLGLLGIASVGTLQAQFQFAPPVEDPFNIVYPDLPGNDYILYAFAADFDQDGDDDVAFLSHSGYPSVWSFEFLENNSPVYPYLAAPVDPGMDFDLSNMHAVDLDQDGDLDRAGILIASPSYTYIASFVTYQELQGGTLLDAPVLSDWTDLPINAVQLDCTSNMCWGMRPSTVYQVDLADMDGDGEVEMAAFGLSYVNDFNSNTLTGEYQVNYFEHNAGLPWPGLEREASASLPFQLLVDAINAGNRFAPYPAWTAMRFGDMDGDGDDDLLIGITEDTDPVQFTLFAVENTGTSFSADLLEIWTDFYPYHPEFMDVDGDGDMDVLMNYAYNDINSFPPRYWNRFVYLENITARLTAVEERTALEFSIYPNPASSVATLRLEEQAGRGPYQIEILDPGGRTVAAFSTGASELHLTKKETGTGLFLVRIVTEDGLSSGSGHVLFLE